MIACYARGDGLGHLTRIRAALHTLGRDAEPVTILTGSEFAADPRVVGDWTVQPVETPATLTAPDELIVDAFPAGLKGELTAAMIPSGTRVTHLARRLRWNAYRPLVPADPPHFDRTFVLEPLEADHLAYLQKVSGEITPLTLVDPPAKGAEISGWLIVHSGPDEEILELVAYARETAALEGLSPAFTLIAPHRPDDLPADVAHLDVYPAWPLAEHAGRIVTAAGFNAVRQFAAWRDRHRIVPFPRTLDDQFARAAALRSTWSTGRRPARS
ncbi:hypothetical protein J4573_09460 [Actinomadura barringtoniae]|uniref:Uncharacterized protein n=1 Tax=Actinomadura barringtoniae TaxID=1427535 RepID=A0A939P7R0_9ACTN|nr:hypothetical protein [Actinomadura barringtoniae]MBO2447311.1 hypothetical protein [Actinomadura barringtoniae]